MSMHPAPAARGAKGVRAAILVACAFVFLALPNGGLAIVNLDEGDGLADYDSRTAFVQPTDAQLEAVDALGASATWSQFGTPSTLIKRGGYLATGIQAADAESAARAWLQSVSALYGLDSASSLQLYRTAPLGPSQAVFFRQSFGGLTSTTDGIATVAVSGSAANGWNIVFASSTLAPSAQTTGSAELTAVEAYVKAADAAGADISVVNVDVAGTRQGWTHLDVAGLSEDAQLVRHVAFPTPKRGVLNAYDTFFTANGANEGYRQVVDAQTGQILLRESTVENLADNPQWKVFPANPPLTAMGHYPWNYPSADKREVWCWTKVHGCKLEVANPASPAPWDFLPTGGTRAAPVGAPTFTTNGNNNNAQETWGPGTASGYRPTSPTRDYIYPWTNVWYETKCDPANFVVGSGNDIDAAITNLFVMHNRLHDFAYNLGFTEMTWNSQRYNYGSPFLENDPLTGRAQSGAVSGSRNNANMSTGADGTTATTNMFLWQPQAGAFYPPCVDGDYDMSVIGHEFGHMVENRMIAKGLGPRQGTHAGAMGEAFGDLNATEYLLEYDYVPVDGESPTAVGPYATGNPFRGIRNLNFDWTSAGHFPEPGKTQKVDSLNLGSYGYDIVGPEVHSDGELWTAVNWDLRGLLLDRYHEHGKKRNVECANGERPADECPGNRRWFQLYHDAMLLMPRNTTILQARDAILAADMARFGGANQDLLWRGFARRGFGQAASVLANNDTNPVPDFTSPLEDEAAVTFVGVAKDEAGNPPVTFDLYVGDYEARVTPIAHTKSFVDDKRGYNFVARANGYGLVRFHLDKLDIGGAQTVTIHFPTNVASTSKGAVATGDGTNHVRLIDDTETTNWSSTVAPVEGKQVVVALGGERTFDVAKVSAYLVPGNNRWTAMRQFELWSCTAGADPDNPTCDGTIAAGWKRFLKSQKDAFPGQSPRPVAPDMQLRTWDVHKTTATHVKLVVLTNQCTGDEEFQGEQDNDPRATTDCRTNATANSQVRATELELLTSKVKVDGAKKEE
jgi:extracellular elastinolytic metalloproteinase